MSKQPELAELDLLVDPSLKDMAETLAHRKDITVDELTEQALRHYLKTHQSEEQKQLDQLTEQIAQLINQSGLSPSWTSLFVLSNMQTNERRILANKHPTPATLTVPLHHLTQFVNAFEYE